MAELAIPLIALGSMYVISNQDESKEGYTNMGKPPNELPNVNPPVPAVNYPITKKVNDANVRIYKNPNQTTDKFYNQNYFHPALVLLEASNPVVQPC